MRVNWLRLDERGAEPSAERWRGGERNYSAWGTGTAAWQRGAW